MADKSKMTPNKPVKSDREGKKKMVLASKDGKQKLIHYGDTNYKHNYSKEAKDSFRARHNCDDNKDKFSAAYWACKDLWPKNKNNFNCGGVVDGPEVVKGDNIKNDVVKANLSAGEMVIPKTVVQEGPDAIKEFAKEELERVNMNQGGLVQDEFDLGTGLDDEFDLGTGLEEQSKEDISASESLARGATQGVTFGFGDEGSGLVDVGLDSAMSALNKLGITDESPSQVASRLKSEGFTGDLGPSTTQEIYTQGRDEERKRNALAEETNPYLYGGASIAGSVASAPATLALGAPLGVAKNAPLATKIAKGAANALPLGVLNALGLSEGETAKELATDAAVGAGVGLVAGGALPLVGAGISKSKDALKNTQLKRVFGEKLDKSYKLGTEGYDLSIPQNYLDEVQKLNDEIKQISKLQIPEAEKARSIEVIESRLAEISKQEKEVNALKKGLKTVDTENIDNKTLEIKNNISEKEQLLDDYLKNKKIDLEQKFDQINNEVKNAAKASENLQLAKNAEETEFLKKKLSDTSLKLQSQVGQAKNNLSAQYEKIDNKVKELALPVDNRETASEFLAEIESNVTPQEFKSFTKKMQVFMNNKDFDNHLNFKKYLTQLRNNNNIAIKKAAGKAYSKTNENIKNTLESVGEQDLAVKLSDTNKKWMTLIDIEDNFVDNINPDRITKKNYLGPQTAKTVSAFQENNINQSSGTVPEFSDKLNILMPESASQTLEEISQLGRLTKQNKEFVPQVNIEPNPELNKINSLLEDYKRGRYSDPQSKLTQKLIQEDQAVLNNLAQDKNLLNEASEVGLNQVDNLKSGLRDERLVLGDEMSAISRNEANERRLANILTSTGQEAKNVGKELEIQKILDLVNKNKGPKIAEETKKRLTSVGDKLPLIQDVKKPGDWKTLFLNPTSLANRSGLAVKRLTDLTKKDTAELQNTAQKFMNTNNSVLRKYGEMISEAANKQGASRNAVLFSLMQQPSFKRAYEQIETEDEAN